MILVDVNVLVYAASREFPEHASARAWLLSCLGGSESISVPEEVLAACIRLLTNHRVLRAPLSGQEALDFCRAVREAPAVVPTVPSAQRWMIFAEFVTSLGLRGNAVPDALLAATAKDLGARIATFDKGFHRFPGVAVLEPASPAG